MCEGSRDQTASGETKSLKSIVDDAFQVVFGRLLITFLLLLTTWGTVTYAL